MIDKTTSYWTELISNNKLLIKQLVIASILLYAAVQLVGLLIPVAITGYACYWVYKAVLTDSPRVMK